jgi:hypothetical protein
MNPSRFRTWKGFDDRSSRRLVEFSSSIAMPSRIARSRDTLERPSRDHPQHPRGAKPQRSHLALVRASRLSRAYITRSPVQQHASRVTVQWRSSGRKAEEEEEEGARAMTKQREGERRGWPADPPPPSFVVVGRCFRLRRPCVGL